MAVAQSELTDKTDARELLPRIEIAGVSVLCLSSNVRRAADVPWDRCSVGGGLAQEGNLVLAQVEEVGARKEMEYFFRGYHMDVPLKKGDYIVGVMANRHSSTSEYGEVPAGGIVIQRGTSIDLLAAGGVLGIARGIPKTLGKHATKVIAVGILFSPDGNALDIRDTVPLWETALHLSAPIILSCGTAAEIGKTTTAKNLIDEFKLQGFEKIAATKLNGTGRKRDITSLSQAGASPALDFPDVGLATTYTSQERYIPAIYTLLNRINQEGSPEVIFAECGGDIIEANIPTLLKSDVMRYVAAIFHSSTDVLSIIGSLSFYKQWGILNTVPLYLTYPFTRNNVATVARLRQLGIDLPIFDPLNKEERAAVVSEIIRSGRIF